MIFDHNYQIIWSNGQRTDCTFYKGGSRAETKEEYATLCSKDMVKRIEDGEFRNSTNTIPVGFAFVMDGNHHTFNWEIKGGTPK